MQTKPENDAMPTSIDAKKVKLLLRADFQKNQENLYEAFARGVAGGQVMICRCLESLHELYIATAKSSRLHGRAQS